MRSAILWCPPYLRFILTAEKKESKMELWDRMLKLLSNSKQIEIADDLTFAAEGRQLVEFAYKQLAGPNLTKDMQSTSIQQETD